MCWRIWCCGVGNYSVEVGIKSVGFGEVFVGGDGVVFVEFGGEFGFCLVV